MSEHIVARALRARAGELNKRAQTEANPIYKGVAQMIAIEYAALADELGAIGQQPVSEPQHPQFRVRTDPRLATQVDLSRVGQKTITIGHDRITRAAARMCDAYMGDNYWSCLAEAPRLQWVQLAMLGIEAALGPDNG